MSLRRVWQAMLVTVVVLITLVLVQGCVPVPPRATIVPSATIPPTVTSSPPGTATTPATATVAPTASATSSPPEAASPQGTPGATGASVDGHWEGTVAVAGQNLIARVDLASDGGVLKGTVDFPQQNANGLQLQKVSYDGGKVHFEVLPQPNTAIFDGALQGADKITGMFEQAGFKGTFSLERATAKSAEPVPYRQEEVTFRNGDVTLAGTLTLPPTQGPHPAVVLITGSGPENRDEEIFGFKIFGVLADHLTRKGIAVLRYDDRGVGGSSPGTPQDTSETYAGDVLAAVQYLKGRPDINPKEIGLLGHSEGGIIAPMAATRSPDIAFIILMSAPGLPGDQILEAQMKLILQANGVSEDKIEEQISLQKRSIEAALTGKGWDEIKADLLKWFLNEAASMPEERRKALGDVNQWADRMVQAQLESVQSPWMKFFLTYDPAPALEKVKVPVLALFGGLDLQVPAEANRDAIMKALDKGGNKDHTAKVFPDANHLYQKAVTGSPNEYASLKPEFTAGFLDTISDWILARVQVPAK
jgi:pimeloyl-ACP methyl ester carboxylesterase